jgi:hypothetical protein
MSLLGVVWLPVVTLIALLILVLLRHLKVHRSPRAPWPVGLWTAGAGWVSGYCGTLVSAALVVGIGLAARSNGWGNLLIALVWPLEVLIILVSLGLLMRLSLRHWLILAGLMCAGALVAPLLATVSGTASESAPVIFGLLSAVTTAVGFTAGLAILMLDGAL